MGTSTSYRSPSTPRWSAFVAALSSDESLDRVRSELFNAGNEWQVALSSAAVASFASTVERLFSEMPARLEGSLSPASVVGDVLAEARAASHEAGFSPATPVAERALARLLLGTLAGAEGSSAAAEQWVANRGQTSGDAVARYLGEVLGQYARHVTDREAGRLAERQIGASASAVLSTDLAATAQALASVVYRANVANEQVDMRWHRLVSAAFEAGRALPGHAR